eukprot:TRINITY_DN14529_c0_g1_i1.p1 TRINITY_DN14529_c0_g1~~TRINITY_DN14529_c0_g1_i1.p1  ORF type:complete len:669 (+),score=123.16 TRINITY_DN14529_c0_g1_i1:43-2049(+)
MVDSRMATRGVCKDNLVTGHFGGGVLAARYDAVRALGRGSGSGNAFHVTLVREKSSGELRVCKAVTTRGLPARLQALVRGEVQLLRKLDHPYVVRLYEYAEDVRSGLLALVLEHVPGGDCGERLRRRGGAQLSVGLGESLVSRIARQLLAALAYCHGCGVLHRDVRPENIVLTAGPQWSRPDCKLVDFGFADHAGGSVEYRTTPEYLAPEITAQAGTHSEKSDVWSAGICILEMLTGSKPFVTTQVRGDSGAVDDVIDGYAAPLPASAEAVFAQLRAYNGPEAILAVPEAMSLSVAARDFLYVLLQRSPARRPNAIEAGRHMWLACGRGADAGGVGRTVGLSDRHLKSLAIYATAPALARCCALVAATRAVGPDVAELGVAFLDADADGDGRLSLEDITGALACATDGSFVPQVSAKDVLESADLSNSGCVDFTEFVAACLYACDDRSGLVDFAGRADCSLSPAIGAATRAFQVLDAGRNGCLNFMDAVHVFRERDALEFSKLPQDRPFGIDEWLLCLGLAGDTQHRNQAAAEPLTPTRPMRMGTFAGSARCFPARDAPIADAFAASDISEEANIVGAVGMMAGIPKTATAVKLTVIQPSQSSQTSETPKVVACNGCAGGPSQLGGILAQITSLLCTAAQQQPTFDDYQDTLAVSLERFKGPHVPVLL